MIHRVPKIVRFGLILVTTALLGACAEGPGGTKATPAPTPDPDPPAQPLNWANVLAEHQVEEATYIIGYQVADGRFIHKGTGFAAHYEGALWTNAHVVEAMRDDMAADAHLKPISMAVRSGTTRGGSGTYRLLSATIHPEYDFDVIPWTPDVAMYSIDGVLPVVLNLLPRQHVTELQVGQPIATMGFPGELNDWGEYDRDPIATFKDGTISALRMYSLGSPTPANTKIVQHNLHLSKGTSGSLIIDHQGYVVAVNHAGELALVEDEDGNVVEVSRGLIDYAVRIDEAWAIVDMVEASGAAKRVAASSREPVGDYQPFPENWDGATEEPIR